MSNEIAKEGISTEVKTEAVENQNQEVKMPEAAEEEEISIAKVFLKSIPIKNLKPSIYNTYETEEYEDLKGNLKTVGLISPLSVIGPDEKGMYEILAGERRYKAFCEMYGSDSDEELPCLVKGPITMDPLLQQMIIESSNMEVRDFDRNAHCLKIMKILVEMAKSGKVKYHKIVEISRTYMPYSERYRRFYLTIVTKGTEELEEMVADGGISVRDAGHISQKDEETQNKIVQRIKDGESSTEVLKEYQKHKENESKSDAKIQSEFLDDGENIPESSYMEDDMGDTNYEPNMAGGYEMPDTGRNINVQIPSSAPQTPLYPADDKQKAAERAMYKDAFDEEDIMKEDTEEDIDDYLKKMQELGAGVNLEVSTDSTGLLGNMRNDIKEHSEKRRKETAAMVARWGESILNKDESSLTEEELEAIEMCKRVAEHF